MLITTASLASVIVALIGGLIFWANPRRKLNQTVFTCSLHLGLWLGCLHLAITWPPGEGLIWLRLACAVAAFWPLHFRIVKESVVGEMDGFDRQFFKWAWGWILVSTLLASIPFTDYFIPAHSTSSNRAYGWGYYVYIAVDLALYCYLFLRAFQDIRTSTGSRRLELQVWGAGGSSMIIALFATMILNMVTHDRVYIRLQPLLILGFYGCTVYAITAYRIFDARQLILIGLEKTLLVTAVAGAAYCLDQVIGAFLPAAAALLVTTALALWLATALNGWLDRIFHFYPQATSARQAAFAVGRRETRVEGLEKHFLELLRGWGQTEHALMLAGAKGSLRGNGTEISDDCAVVRSLRQLRWATPERLARERSTPDREALARFMVENGLGVVVIGEGPTLTALVGVGIPASRRSFTYPQVTQLLEMASIIESALERVHFSVKAQHAEQLATVGLLGASFAHEIRNPLVTIKTFVQLLPKHHQDPVFREKFFSLIGDEVTRIDRLTEQLLDLAAPRKYQAQDIELHPILCTSLELVAAKATDKRISFLNDFKASPDRVITDASATKQVLLNLCFNAIQAVETMEGERWVKVSTRNVPKGIEVLIEDSGPGISPEIRPRLFQPFQSTKSSGFGLGLAICSDILVGLDASIVVDPSEPGRGATFRIVFPCPA